MPKTIASDAEFKRWADLFPEALLLVDTQGKLLGANAYAVSSQLVAATSVGASLHDITDDRTEDLNAYLKQCSRSRGGVMGSLRLGSQNARVRCQGSLLAPAANGNMATLLLRVLTSAKSVEQFSVLTEKVSSLAREVELRKVAEAELRHNYALAVFGHKIGVTLAQDASLAEMLRGCCQSIVDHLGAAFARVWLAEDDGETLTLTASAGMYTHLDGAHAHIKFGQFKIGLIAAEQSPHLTNCVPGDERVHDQAWARREKMVAFAGYPLVIDGRTVGVIAMFAQHELSERTLESLESVSNSIALGISRKHAEAKLLEYANELVQADRRKDEFLAMLAHELRNPLAPLRSGLELLNLESGEHAETLGLMKEQVQHLARLVDDLLDISRIMRDKIELRRTPVELNACVRSAFKSIERANTGGVHNLYFQDFESPIWVNADPVRLSQILMNLLNNAVKYTPAGGSIWLEYGKRDEQATISVRDSGIGIEGSFLARVFDLFAQADQSLDRTQGGLGIGLTLTRRLVELHGGTIHVASAGLNQGSEFTICLPVTNGPPGKTPQETAQETGQSVEQESHRILVVDDSVGSAKILKRLLQAVGQTEVETAHDGHAAVDTARKFRPEIIFLDIGLPGLNGYEVAAALRSDAAFGATLIVALTGYGDAKSRVRTAESGFDQHLVKPVSLGDLRSVLSHKQD